MKRSVMMLGSAAMIAAAMTFGGCGAKLPKRTGFLSTYERLDKSRSSSFGFSAEPGTLGRYDRFIVEPVEVRIENTKNVPQEEAARIAVYLRAQVERELGEGYEVVQSPGEGVGRVRMVLTQVTRSTMIMNLHPGMKVTGGGLGGAAMEAEIVDSRSGEQVWALVEARKGNQMELDAFKPFDDAEDAAEMWAALMRRAIDAARAAAGVAPSGR
jgi:hypothetical protein